MRTQGLARRKAPPTTMMLAAAPPPRMGSICEKYSVPFRTVAEARITAAQIIAKPITALPAPFILVLPKPFSLPVESTQHRGENYLKGIFLF